MIAEPCTPSSPILTPEAVVREMSHLPSAPKVLPRLKELLLDGNSSMADIVVLIRVDPGIAARVLQLGNSAFFNTGARCLTVEESVHRVGFDRVYQLVSYAVSSEVLVRPLTVYDIEAEELWRMSVAGALAAEALAACTQQDQNVAYTVGLLHCVGMVALDEWARHHDGVPALPRCAYPRESTAAERAAFGFTQADVGCALLQQWGFPGTIYEPVRRQYAPGATMAHLRMASLLSAAKWLRDSARGGDPPPFPDAAVLKPLALPVADLEALVPVVTERMQAVQAMLGDAVPPVINRQFFPRASWQP